MTAYIGVDGKARKLASWYVGVDGVARKVTKAYVGIDGVARLWWAADAGGGPIVLEVEKITSDTYAGETTYTGEQFILLDIYPRTNGTVSVTYGGLTKTVTDTSGAAEPNAQQVFFGTFNGVSDSVETPASGELVIVGEYRAFGVGGFETDSKGIKAYKAQIVEIVDFGNVSLLPWGAFNGQSKITSAVIPNSVTSIGGAAFQNCSSLSSVIVSDNVEDIGSNAFYNCKSLKTISLPNCVKSIGNNAFSYSSSLESVTILAETPPTITPNSSGEVLLFISCHALSKVIVPVGCSAAYKAAEGWSAYADYITEAS